MKITAIIPAALPMIAIAGVLALSACGGGYYYASSYVPPPPPAPAYGYASGYAPGPGFVWTEGYWDLRGGHWYRKEGRWQRAPHARAVWVAPRWERNGERYRFHSGYWR